jgi:hypothetical protein
MGFINKDRYPRAKPLMHVGDTVEELLIGLVLNEADRAADQC